MFYFIISLSLNSPPPNDSETLPPHISPRWRALPNILSYCFRQLWVDCCIFPSNGGHLRPRPRPPLCISIPLFSPLQTSKPTTANASPMARGLRMMLGSGGAMSWWRRSSTHGGRGVKPLEGRVAAAHFGCCSYVLCCVFVSCGAF